MNAPAQLRTERELLPCPFCGDAGDKGIVEYVAPQTGATWQQVKCRGCGATCSLTAWNTRALLAGERKWPTGEAGDWINDVVLDIAELPDRTSPDNFPQAMLVTAEELREIINNNAPTFLAPPQQEWLDPELLGDILEFLQDQYDTRDGEDGRPLPNQAMRLGGELEQALAKRYNRPPAGEKS